MGAGISVLRLSFLMAIAFSITGCMKSAHENLSTKKLNLLKLAVAAEPSYQSVTLTREGLTRLDPKSIEPRALPALAASWSAPTPTRYLFKLAPGLRSSEGAPFVAAQVVAHWRKLVRECRTSMEAAHLLFPVAMAKKICDGKAPSEDLGIEALDKQTLLVQLERAAPFFPEAVAHPALALDGMGPFVRLSGGRGGPLEIANPVRYARNPYYHGAPRLDGIEIRVEPALERRLQLFLDGSVDVTTDLPDDLPAIQGAPFRMEPTRDVAALGFNFARRPFDDPEVRRAFAESIQNEEIVRVARWRHQPIPATPAPFDPAAGSKILSRHDPGRPTLSLGNGPAGTLVAENLQAQWEKNLGIRVELVDAGPDDKRRSRSAPGIYQVDLRENPFDPVRNDEPTDAIPLFRRVVTLLVRDRVKGFHRGPLETWELRETVLD